MRNSRVGEVQVGRSRALAACEDLFRRDVRRRHLSSSASCARCARLARRPVPRAVLTWSSWSSLLRVFFVVGRRRPRRRWQCSYCGDIHDASRTANVGFPLYLRAWSAKLKARVSTVSKIPTPPPIIDRRECLPRHVCEGALSIGECRRSESSRRGQRLT